MNTTEAERIKKSVDREITLAVVSETGSTNDDLKAAARAGATDYSVLIAHRQTGGRGREGRSFFSEGGLYMSVLLPWREDSAPFVTHIAAVAVARAIKATAGVTPAVKWVNDLYVDGKKVCGILAESVLADQTRRLVVWIGVNVGTAKEDFPPEIKKIAGSVTCDKSLLAAAILNRLFALFDDFSAERVREAYRAYAFPVGTCLTVIKGSDEREATAQGFSDDLGLIVAYADGTRETLISGEVRIKVAL